VQHKNSKRNGDYVNEIRDVPLLVEMWHSCVLEWPPDEV